MRQASGDANEQPALLVLFNYQKKKFQITPRFRKKEKSLSGNMGPDEFSTWWAGKESAQDGTLNICRKYYGVTQMTLDSVARSHTCYVNLWKGVKV